MHGRPSAYKRTGGRKVYDFIGRVGQLSLWQFDADAAACIIIIIIVCMYCRSTHAERHRYVVARGPDHAHVTIYILIRVYCGVQIIIK